MHRTDSSLYSTAQLHSEVFLLTMIYLLYSSQVAQVVVLRAVRSVDYHKLATLSLSLYLLTLLALQLKLPLLQVSLYVVYRYTV